MSKRMLCIMVVVLTVSSITLAGGFAGAQVNGSFRMGPYSTGTNINSGATGYPTSGAAGAQAASTQGCTGTGVVIQGQGAAGAKYKTCGAQGQGLIAGQGQAVVNTGKGSASGAQFGAATQNQAHYSCAGTSTQSQTASGSQIGMAVGTNCGSAAAAGGVGGIGAYQYQKY